MSSRNDVKGSPGSDLERLVSAGNPVAPPCDHLVTVEIGDRGDSERELAERARRGDREAFGLLFERHLPMLMAVCRRALEGCGGVDEVVQDTAVAALLGMAGLRNPERFGSWLVGIGLNLCRRRLRAVHRLRSDGSTLPGGIWLDQWTEGEPDPAIVAEERELRISIARAIAELPRGQRDAVVAFYLGGLTHAETASSLGIAVGAVKTRLHKARERLRPQLSSEGKEWVMSPPTDGTVEMRLTDVVRVAAEDEGSPQWVIVLDEASGDRRLPIWVGEAEATWVAMAIEGTELPRPGPYKMVKSMLDAVGTRIREVRIERLVEATFYATVELEGTFGTASIDARPSDALNMAALTGSKIRVATDVLADAEVGGNEPFYSWLSDALAGDAPSSSAIAAEAKERWERSVAQFAERKDRDT
jgi:RNA polymerase sigma factor (sigma-70 family)